MNSSFVLIKELLSNINFDLDLEHGSIDYSLVHMTEFKLRRVIPFDLVYITAIALQLVSFT